MQFEKESKVTHPASTILEIMIDRMHEIVPFLPNVVAIDVQSRTEDEQGRPQIVRRWQGKDTSAPKGVRPFLKEEHMAWIDHALWIPAEHRVEWRLETVAMARLYECSGCNYFEPHPDDPERATRIRITGDLVVFPERLPVPKFLGKRLAPQIEKFVVNLITPNLTDVAVGLQGYLDSVA